MTLEGFGGRQTRSNQLEVSDCSLVSGQNFDVYCLVMFSVVPSETSDACYALLFKALFK